jgi:hypothetical protein
MFDGVYAWMVREEVSAIVGWLGLFIGMLGLGLTVAVFRSTSAIRQAFLTTARVPKQLDELQSCASEISNYLAGDDLDSVELRRQVIRSGEIVGSISQKAKASPEPLRRRIAKFTALVAAFERERTKDSLKEIYVQVQGICEALSQWLQDRNWSTHDGN